jgi:hypothetical protein
LREQYNLFGSSMGGGSFKYERRPLYHIKSNAEKVDELDSSYFFDQKRERGYTFEESDKQSRILPNDTTSIYTESKKSLIRPRGISTH